MTLSGVCVYYCVSRYVLHSSPISHCHVDWRASLQNPCSCVQCNVMLLHVLYLSISFSFLLHVYGCQCIRQCRCTNCVCVRMDSRAYICVCVYIFPAALPPGMQHGSSEGDISADRRASFPSPLPSGVALNIKLFNLIQFPTTNTLDWIQMPAASGPTPGPVCAYGFGYSGARHRSWNWDPD